MLAEKWPRHTHTHTHGARYNIVLIVEGNPKDRHDVRMIKDVTRIILQPISAKKHTHAIKIDRVKDIGKRHMLQTYQHAPTLVAWT